MAEFRLELVKAAAVIFCVPVDPAAYSTPVVWVPLKFVSRVSKSLLSG